MLRHAFYRKQDQKTEKKQNEKKLTILVNIFQTNA